jgi:hypothetical protein
MGNIIEAMLPKKTLLASVKDDSNTAEALIALTDEASGRVYLAAYNKYNWSILDELDIPERAASSDLGKEKDKITTSLTQSACAFASKMSNFQGNRFNPEVILMRNWM